MRDGRGPPLSRSLQLMLVAPDEVRLGQVADLVLTVRNRSQQNVEFQHSSQPFDIVVTGEDGREVWRWSRMWGSNDDGVENVLKPGEADEYRDAWDLHDQECAPVRGMPCKGNLVAPGKYLVRATFKAAVPYTPGITVLAAGPATIEVASGQYDFAVLNDWRVRLRGEILHLDGVEGIGIDKKTNRVAVFVAGDEFRELVLYYSDSQGIPRGAVEFHTMGPTLDEDHQIDTYDFAN